MADGPSRIAVVGVGAMGSVFAGLFASAGHQVTVIGRPGAQIDAIRQNGLRVEGASGDRTVQVQALEAPGGGPFDLVVLAVKATQVEDAAAGLTGLVGPQTVLLAMQNGLGAADIVADAIGGERLAIGIAAGYGASVVAPGHARHTGMGPIKMGAYADLPSSAVETVAALWREAGFNAAAADDIAAMQWQKLMCNAAFSAPCAITGMTVSEVFGHADMKRVSLDAGKEAWTIAKARGIEIGIDDPDAYIAAFAERVGNAKPSLLQDIEAGRQSEIDFINGAVPREATKAGKTAKVNETLTSIVKAMESRRSGSAQ